MVIALAGILAGCSGTTDNPPGTTPPFTDPPIVRDTTTTDPSPAGQWRAAFEQHCVVLTEARDQASSEHIAESETPTVEQLVAFYTAYQPSFGGFVDDLRSLTPPPDLEEQVTVLLGAADARAAEIQAAIDDPAAAEAQRVTGGSTDGTQQLFAAESALGVSSCA